MNWFKIPQYIKEAAPGRLFYFFFLIIVFSNCNKNEEIELNWTELDSKVSSTLTGVHFTDALHGHAVGGDSWFLGLYLETTDGGENWQVDSFTNKQLFGLHFTDDHIGHTVGIDGYLFKKEDLDIPWEFHRLPRWDILRDVCFYDKNKGVVVGGVAFKSGVIMTIGPDYTTVAIDTFENEIDAVCFSDESTVHVSGYGIILRSTDGGLTWTESETSGDWFRTMQFPTPNIGYIAGYTGTILKTTDNGQNWREIRKAKATRNVPFRSLHFVDAEKGYIVGDDGTFWRTLDGGDSWQVVKGLPNVDFYDIHVIENTGYIVGTDGRIFRFED